MTIKKIRSHFPLLSRKMNGYPIAYFDNASTTQKPKSVIDAITKFYTTANANIHRGVYALSQEATQQYEDARVSVSKFINAHSQEIIFTKGCTESINLVAATWAKDHLKVEDFKKNNIEVQFQNFQHPVYKQLYGDFIPNMCIIDLLFNEGNNSKKILLNSITT